MPDAKSATRLLFRVVLYQRHANRIQISGRLRRRDPRLQMPKHIINPMIAPRSQKTLAVYLFLIHDGHKEIGRESHKNAEKSRRRYSNDGEGMLVELNDSPNH